MFLAGAVSSEQWEFVIWCLICLDPKKDLDYGQKDAGGYGLCFQKLSGISFALTGMQNGYFFSTNNW